MDLRWNERPTVEQLERAIRAFSHLFGVLVPPQIEVDALLRSQGIVVREGDER